MPNWSQFAWAAFLYGPIGGDRQYQTLMKNASFLSELRSNPADVADDEVRENLLKGYLNAWRTHVKNTPQSASAIKESISNIIPYLMALSGFSIKSINFAQQVNVGNRQLMVSQTVESCYELLRPTGHNIAATATGKMLHILNPELFVMWDGPILKHFCGNSGIADSPQEYRAFLQQMNQDALTVCNSFATAILNSSPLPAEDPEAYLSRQMNYNPTKTMAKFLDEYYWVTITNKVMVPARWHP